MFRHLGYQETEECIDGIAKELSNRSTFAVERPEFYYYVREPSLSIDFESHA